MMKLKLFIYGLFLSFWVMNAAAQPASFAPLAERVLPSAVNISAQIDPSQDNPETVNGLLFDGSDGQTALGSGFILDAEGYIATCAHVIDKTSAVSVTLHNGETYPAQIVGQDALFDLAVLKIRARGLLTPVVFGQADNVHLGDWVLAVGNPFGLGNSVSAGIVSGKSRRFRDNAYEEYFQTDAVLAPGYSGGPLFNTNGEVIGIHNALLTTNGGFQGVSFALSAADSKEILERLQKDGKILRSTLGVTFGMRNGSDLTVIALENENIAAENNLQTGDVILEINGEKIPSERDFLKKITLSPVGTTFKLAVLRRGETFLQNVKTFAFEKSAQKATQEVAIPLIEENNQFNAAGLLTNGNAVVAVEPESPAAQKGIEKGDIVLKVNGEKLGEPNDLKFYLDEAVSEQVPLQLELQNVKTDEPYAVELFSKTKNNDAD